MRPIERLERNGVVLGRQPPVIVTWCRPPPTGRADWPCAARSALCNGDSARCDRCHFAYCTYHLPLHRATKAYPPDAWRSVVRRFEAQLDRAVERVKKNLPSRVEVHVPEVEDESRSA